MHLRAYYISQFFGKNPMARPISELKPDNDSWKAWTKPSWEDTHYHFFNNTLKSININQIDNKVVDLLKNYRSNINDRSNRYRSMMSSLEGSDTYHAETFEKIECEDKKELDSMRENIGIIMTIINKK